MPDYPRCKTCRHYEKNDHGVKAGPPDGDHLFECLRIPRYDEVAPDVFPDDYWYEASRETAEELATRMAYRKEIAVAKDASGCYAAILVADDFGCVLHEPMPGTPAGEKP